MRVGGLSRRQLLRRFGGGCAGWTLASLGLRIGPSPAAAAGSVSLRDLLRRISDKGCDPSHGIRVGLPSGSPGTDDHPVISLRAVAGRYAGCGVNYCEPLGFSVRTEAVAGGGLTAYLTGQNFTCGGMAAIQYTSDIRRDDRSFSVPVQPDGTFATVFNLGCTSPGLALWSLMATDTATRRSSPLNSGEYTCPQPMPPPPPTPPSITVSQMGSTFTVKGMGFLKAHPVYIHVTVQVIANGAVSLADHSFPTSSDPSGAINPPGGYSVSIPCDRGALIYFQANDGRLAPAGGGDLWSNTVMLTCQ